MTSFQLQPCVSDRSSQTVQAFKGILNDWYVCSKWSLLVTLLASYIHGIVIELESIGSFKRRLQKKLTKIMKKYILQYFCLSHISVTYFFWIICLFSGRVEDSPFDNRRTPLAVWGYFLLKFCIYCCCCKSLRWMTLICFYWTLVPNGISRKPINGFFFVLFPLPHVIHPANMVAYRSTNTHLSGQGTWRNETHYLSDVKHVSRLSHCTKSQIKWSNNVFCVVS